MKPNLSILPAAQEQFWNELGGSVPSHFVLYGGTAIALRLGHRASIDFDFFSDQAVDYDRLTRDMPSMKKAVVLDRQPNTVIASMPMASGEVKVSFFGGLTIGRVGEPDRVQGKFSVAAPIDLLATKLKTLHDRIEVKDYLDIEALLRSGLTLNQGIAAARSLFGQSLNPLDTAKAVGWFKDGDLDRRLSSKTKDFLAAASARFDPNVAPLDLKSRTLAPGLRPYQTK